MHASSSNEQQHIEPRMRDAIATKLGVRWAETTPNELRAIRLDAFASAGPDGRPVLVEIFAHVGKRKAGQAHKIARDMTKLLYAEHQLGLGCMKVLVLVAVGTDRHALTGWQAKFAHAFGIDTHFVELDPAEASVLMQAQRRQRR